jgi:hypothetical protein
LKKKFRVWWSRIHPLHDDLKCLAVPSLQAYVGT